MRLKVKDLKIGDKVILTDTYDLQYECHYDKILTITSFRKFNSSGRTVANTDEELLDGSPFFLEDDDTFESATAYINEQKLKNKLGL